MTLLKSGNLEKDSSEQKKMKIDSFEKATSEKGQFWKGRT